MSLCCEVLKALEGKSLVTAESLTGGGIGAALTAVPGSSEVYKGGVICYTNWVKENVLGVPGEVLARFGAVSSQTAGYLASGVRELLKADVAVAVTGLAGPGGDEFGHPVGTVFTPKHPKTKPTLGQVLHAEEKLDREALITRALENIEKIKVSYHDEPVL